MKNNKIVPITLVGIFIVLVAILITLIFNGNYFEFSNSSNNKENNLGNEKEKITEVTDSRDNNTTINNETNDSLNKVDVSKEESIVNNKENEIKNDTPIIKDDVSNDNNSESVTETFNENDVINYFKDYEKIGNEQDDRTTREKIKEIFISIVDFIFYDKEIKGYTFSELTNKAKLEIIKIAFAIDNKIDEYFPDYKNTIKDKYTDIKGKLAVKYLEFTASLCDSVGKDVCTQAKEDFNSMKESFGFTWELVKELASSGSSKVKEFYESWRDSE